MRVYAGLIMLAAYFFHSCKSQVEFNCSLMKVDLLAACIALRVVGAVLVVFLRILILIVTYPGSRIQGSKRHRIPDPQHCFTPYVEVL